MALTKVKPTRRPTWLGWLLIAILLLGLLFGFITNIYGFLAPEKPPHEGVMVVEGWIHDFALDEAVTMYRSGNYSKIVCTGVPIETGSYIQQFKSYPEMTAARLRKMGIPGNEIITAIADEAKKDRTYLAAVALREAAMAYNIGETNIHLVTTGPHGRRSRLLFQKALGEDYNIGITCLEDSGYDPDYWYAYSQGVRKVISECIAYTYAKFLFHP
ncbi:MAG: ElyC/SanA/YdcF family protein [Verrucomicrobiota bacterium]|nr:ElyC/SanA/YdcF family protein [Verrucomicrobiota bacterium]